VKANRTTSVGNQPPASQPTAKNTVKHNAWMSKGWRAKMQGQTKKYSFCFDLFGFGQKKKEDFLRMAKRTLVSFGNQTCNFAIMFWGMCCINDFAFVFLFLYFVFVGGKSRL
jgi:hypothetical protein